MSARALSSGGGLPRPPLAACRREAAALCKDSGLGQGTFWDPVLYLGGCLLWRHLRLGVRASGDTFRRGLCQAISARAAHCALPAAGGAVIGWLCFLGCISQHRIQNGERTKRASPQGFNSTELFSFVVIKGQLAAVPAGRVQDGQVLYVVAFSPKARGLRQLPQAPKSWGSAGGRGIIFRWVACPPVRRGAPGLPIFFLALWDRLGRCTPASRPWRLCHGAAPVGEVWGGVCAQTAGRAGAGLRFSGCRTHRPMGSFLRSRRARRGAPRRLSQQRPGSCRWSQVLAACHRPCLGFRACAGPARWGQPA